MKIVYLSSYGLVCCAMPGVYGKHSIYVVLLLWKWGLLSLKCAYVIHCPIRISFLSHRLCVWLTDRSIMMMMNV